MSRDPYLDATELPPKPDPITGQPAPPRAPGFNHKEKSSGTDRNRETNPTKAPAPPEGQGSVLVWYESNRRGAFLVAVWGFIIIAALVTLMRFSIQWMRIWWLWLIILFFAILIYGAHRRTQVSAGAEWLQQWGGGWVRIYELVKITAHQRPTLIELRFVDRDGREISISSSDIQQDRYMWDLVYNGIVHSVVAGGAETNGLLHRAFEVPRPKPTTSR